MNSTSSYLNRRQMLWLMAGAAGSVGLHACTQQSTPSATHASTAATPITIGVTTWIGDTTLYVAKEKGFFQQVGLDVNIRTYSVVADSFPAFSVGQIQGVAPVTSEAISLAANGVDYRIVAVMDTSAGADAIVARNSITDLKDFKGKRVAVQKGTVGHFFLLQVLSTVGLAERDIRIVDISPETAATAYTAGDIEIAYLYSPFVEKAMGTQPDGRVVFDSSKMPSAIADVYAFSGAFIRSNPDIVQSFVNGVFKAVEFLKTNPDEAIAIAAKALNLQPDSLKTQLTGIRIPDRQANLEMLTKPNSNLYLLKPMNDLAAFLKSQKQIVRVPDLSSIIDSQFIKAVTS